MINNIDKPQAGRKQWLDALRGFAMILVVCVHTVSHKVTGWENYNILTGPIMITLFFSITGYVFNSRNGDQKQFYRNLLTKIVVPWVFLSLIWLKAVLIPVKGITWFANQLLAWISGEELWYMPCFVLAEILWFYIHKFCKKTGFVAVAACACFGVGMLMNYFGVGEFAMLNRAFYVQIYILLGYLFRKYEYKLLQIPWKWIVLGALVYVALAVVSIIMLPGQYMDIHLNLYHNLPLCLAMIVLGCGALLLAGAKAQFAPKVLVFLGQNTLVIYMLHTYMFAVLRKALAIVGITMSANWFVAIIETVWALLGCSIAALVMNHFVPELLGKRRIKR